jgi:hypothetical protein
LSNAGVSDVNTALRVSRHVGRDNLVVVETDAEVQVGVENDAGALNGLAQQKLLVHHFANVAPHRQVVDEHFEKVVVLNRVLELFNL